jgi:2-polyprenyl-3-methyl-5-hydroxy-6-metoxy-1,4-benzoquinol methylase
MSVARVTETDTAGPTASPESADGYFSHRRTDILELVPPDAKRILSVGCGAAVTEAELVKAGRTVVGIELNAGAAAVARRRGLEVFEGDAAALDRALEGREFDCLIYADVLEHIADPVAVARGHVTRLRDGGIVIISVPNFRCLMVFRQLFLQGRIQYTDQGVLDRTHLRLTTRKMILDWFAELGLTPVSNRYNRGGRLGRVGFRFLPAFVKEFLATQVVLVARKPASASQLH